MMTDTRLAKAGPRLAWVALGLAAATLGIWKLGGARRRPEAEGTDQPAWAARATSAEPAHTAKAVAPAVG